MTEPRRDRPISRHRLAQLADLLEHQSAVAGEPDWRAVLEAGEEAARGARAHLRRLERRRGRGG